MDRKDEQHYQTEHRKEMERLKKRQKKRLIIGSVIVIAVCIVFIAACMVALFPL